MSPEEADAVFGAVIDRLEAEGDHAQAERVRRAVVEVGILAASVGVNACLCGLESACPRIALEIAAAVSKKFEGEECSIHGRERQAEAIEPVLRKYLEAIKLNRQNDPSGAS